MIRTITLVGGPCDGEVIATNVPTTIPLVRLDPQERETFWNEDDLPVRASAVPFAIDEYKIRRTQDITPEGPRWYADFHRSLGD